MEATAAISLLFAHQSGLLNTAVDAIVPVRPLLPFLPPLLPSLPPLTPALLSPPPPSFPPSQVYTLAVLCLLVTIHRQQPGKGSPSSLRSSSSDEAYLVAFEQDLLRAAKAKEEQQQQQQQRQQQREQEKQKKKAETNKKGEEGGKEETKEGRNEGGKEEGPDFSGVWKSVPSKNSNYDEFLTVQGVPYLKRKIANSTVVTHTIQQDGDVLKLEVRLFSSFLPSFFPSLPHSLPSSFPYSLPPCFHL